MPFSDTEDNYQDPFPNFKIPRKKESDSDSIQTYTTPLNWGPPVTNHDNATTSNNYSQLYNINSNSAPVTYNINAYKSVIKEEPKNSKANKRPFLDSCPDLSDETLPKELTAQFQPLFCKLCQARLCSNTNALLHYKSKNHDKKVRNFLIQHSEKTGEPLHKRAKTKKDNNIEDDDPRSKHCDVCDMDFTSKMHADQHYMGRNHHKALLNKKPPSNCYLGEDGKWHRVQKAKEDLTGRNGIGLAFAKPEEIQNKQSKFFCNVCNIFATSQESLDTHIKGQKHKKALNKIGGQELVYANYYEMDYELSSYGNNDSNNLSELTVSTDSSSNDAWDPHADFSGTDGPKIGAWEPITSPQPERKVTSTCRTPSGQYYCQICNISLNSESQFIQHLDSKRHTKNKQAMAAIKSGAH